VELQDLLTIGVWRNGNDNILPWVFNVTKCAAEQAFSDLCAAFKRFFRHIGGYPCFKKKGTFDSFYLSNDQFKLSGNQVRIPKLGWVKLTESLRFSGKILIANRFPYSK